MRTGNDNGKLTT